jgi:MerR family transcriptional regulator, light-induced transcriptional regulator
MPSEPLHSTLLMHSAQMPALPEGSYPIREFARLSGVNPATLRAWERRYGIVQPLRTPKGHRFYTGQHLEDVRKILYWLEQGYPVRQVRLLLNSQQPLSAGHNPDADIWQEQQLLIQTAVEHFELPTLDHALNDGFANYPAAVFYKGCLDPVLEALRGQSQGHLLCTVLEQRLLQRLTALMQQQQRHASAPRLLLACNQSGGALELLIRACAIGAAGLAVEFLGTSLTPQELLLAAEALRADAIWLHWHPDSDQHQRDWQILSRRTHGLWLSGCSSFEYCDTAGHFDLRPLGLQKQIQEYVLNCGQRENHHE